MRFEEFKFRETSICHFLTNRKSPFFSISQQESVASYEFGGIFVSRSTRILT